eukprot:m.739061 g.739061  ORF g.739061 m.739061 type:complete len:99 (-) comp58917_c0_seq14:202-498(-)
MCLLLLGPHVIYAPSKVHISSFSLSSLLLYAFISAFSRFSSLLRYFLMLHEFFFLHCDLVPLPLLFRVSLRREVIDNPHKAKRWKYYSDRFRAEIHFE